jgi:hypothetical protein
MDAWEEGLAGKMVGKEVIGAAILMRRAYAVAAIGLISTV